MTDWEALAAKLRAADEGLMRAMERVDMAERSLEEARTIYRDAEARKSRAKGDLYDAAFAGET